MAHDLEKKWRSDDVRLQENVDFNALLLSDRVLSGLTKAGFKKPSPIQLEAIPMGRFGKDLLVQAKSGTGKTLVFVIVALEKLKRKLFRPQVLVVAPTREIASQICSVVKSVSSSFPKLTCSCFIGGLPLISDKEKAIMSQIIVGTPGRLKQLIEMKSLPTTSIRLLVYDEADQLLDGSYKDDLEDIFNSLPENKQVIAASATYPPRFKKLMYKYFKDPHVVCLNTKEIALLGMVHYAKIVDYCPMPILQYRSKLAALEQILKSVKFAQCLLFCNGKQKVEVLYRDVKKWGFSAAYISSERMQEERLKAIDRLKHFKCKVLVSSDVTSRGIDAENVDLVVNFDLSYLAETYMHRVGRAGRYGAVGVAITILNEKDVKTLGRTEVVGAFKTYKLPEPIPVDLILHPVVGEYVIPPKEPPKKEFNDGTDENIPEADDTESITLNGNGHIPHEESSIPDTEIFQEVSVCTEHDITSKSMPESVPENIKSSVSVSEHAVVLTEDIENVSVKTAGCEENGIEERQLISDLINDYNGIEPLDLVSDIVLTDGTHDEVVDEELHEIPDPPDIKNGTKISQLDVIHPDAIKSDDDLEKTNSGGTVFKIGESSSSDNVRELLVNNDTKECVENDLGCSEENGLNSTAGLADMLERYLDCKFHNKISHILGDQQNQIGMLTDRNSGDSRISASMLANLNSKKSCYFRSVFEKYLKDKNQSRSKACSEGEKANGLSSVLPQREESGQNDSVSNVIVETPANAVENSSDQSAENLPVESSYDRSQQSKDDAYVKSSKATSAPFRRDLTRLDFKIPDFVSDIGNECLAGNPANFVEDSGSYEKLPGKPSFESTPQLSGKTGTNDKGIDFDKLNSKFVSPSKLLEIFHGISNESDSESSSDQGDHSSSGESDSDVEPDRSDSKESESSSGSSDLSSSSTTSSADESDESVHVRHAPRMHRPASVSNYPSHGMQSNHSGLYRQNAKCCHCCCVRQCQPLQYSQRKVYVPNPHRVPEMPRCRRRDSHRITEKRADEGDRRYSTYQYPLPKAAERHPTKSSCHQGQSACSRYHFQAHKAFHPNSSRSHHQHSVHNHTLSCYLPTEHRCHPDSKEYACQQGPVCAMWYETFYNQWLHIQSVIN